MKIQFFFKICFDYGLNTCTYEIENRPKCLTKCGLFKVFGLFLFKSNVFKLHNFIASCDIKE